ncbi:MAG: virulence factor SrfC family protein, partial [Planctomycetales bacterium]
ESVSRRYASTEIDRSWRLDLLDAYAYMRFCDRRGFQSKEAVVNGMLNRYPLTDEGYIAIAAGMFWDNWGTLTQLFMRINDFLTKIATTEHDPAILTHWAGVRFLLDSQRKKVHERRNSRCFTKVDWADFRLNLKNGWHVLDYLPGQGGGNEQQETIQAAMLELVMPILPHRISEEWRRVIEQIDILDIPGMRAGRQGAEQGKRQAADTLEEQMEIVKRGKVAYLFERYTQELQIQTLLLLARGGNLEVTAQMKHHIDLWGRARYGEAVWPTKVRDAIPALFLGVTGIDEEFRNRDEYADPMLYDARLAQVADALGDVMVDFGGKGKYFNNVYPIRYPGTWDAD